MYIFIWPKREAREYVTWLEYVHRKPPTIHSFSKECCDIGRFRVGSTAYNIPRPDCPSLHRRPKYASRLRSPTDREERLLHIIGA